MPLKFLWLDLIPRRFGSSYGKRAILFPGTKNQRDRSCCLRPAGLGFFFHPPPKKKPYCSIFLPNSLFCVQEECKCLQQPFEALLLGEAVRKNLRKNSAEPAAHCAAQLGLSCAGLSSCVVTSVLRHPPGWFGAALSCSTKG